MQTLSDETAIQEHVDTSPASVGREYWRVLVLAAAVIVLYLPVLQKLVWQWWDDSNYSHGFIVPLFAGYILWERRRSLLKIEPQPALWGLIPLVGGIALLLFGSLASELSLMRLSLLPVIAGLLVFLHGWPLVRRMLLPLGVLLLMIPIPGVVYYQMVFPLQLLASKLAAGTLQVSQIMPVLREGNVLILPSSRLEVAEACSGIRSLMSLLTIAVIYGYLTEERNWIKIVLCLLIVPIAVVSNAARVIFAAVGSEYIGMSAVEGTSHFLSGIVLFLLALLLLLGCHALLRAGSDYAAKKLHPAAKGKTA